MEKIYSALEFRIIAMLSQIIEHFGFKLTEVNASLKVDNRLESGAGASFSIGIRSSLNKELYEQYGHLTEFFNSQTMFENANLTKGNDIKSGAMSIDNIYEGLAACLEKLPPAKSITRSR